MAGTSMVEFDLVGSRLSIAKAGFFNKLDGERECLRA